MISPSAEPATTPLLECVGLHLGYPVAGNWRPVVEDVSFALVAGRTLALVGESGSGKSTIAKALVKLVPVQAGSVRIAGEEVAPLSPAAFAPFRKRIQLVFQDPWQALNPRLAAAELLAEPLRIHFPQLGAAQRGARVARLLDAVKLPAELARRLPSELSGGQRQRLLLARALAVEPEILICDEPVSALDVSIQAQLLDLLAELKAAHHLTLIFISHDLAVVQQIADDVLVLQRGRRVEYRPAADLFRGPEHAYTRMLIDACPRW